jgi:hypothetical protein
MTRHQRILLAGVATCVIDLWAIATLKSQPASSDSRSAIHWIAVSSDAASRDTKVLDVIIRDALTNQEFASTREFYGGVSNNTVRITGFPAGYKPDVPGYRFEPLPSSDHGSGLRLTLALGGMWIDQPPTADTKQLFGLFQPNRAERGALLSFYNSGGPVTNGNVLYDTLGACMIGYGIRQTSNSWNVGLLGYWDP